MDRSAVAAKAGVALIPCEYNNNNIITVGLVPGARRKRNLNIRFTRNTHTAANTAVVVALLLFTRKTFYIGGPPPRRGCNIYNAAERIPSKSRPAAVTGCAAIKRLYLLRGGPGHRFLHPIFGFRAFGSCVVTVDCRICETGPQRGYCSFLALHYPRGLHSALT